MTAAVRSRPEAMSTTAADALRTIATIDVVIPVYNEEVALGPSVRRLHAHMASTCPWSWHITIADNASTDRTWDVACRLGLELEGVTAVHLDAKGRGRAVRAVWSTSRSPVLAYMDVDLSTGLDAFLPLVAPLVSGHSDVAIGTRLARGAQVVRGPRRELISRTYNSVLRTSLGVGFSDAQCGFKAIRRDAAEWLLPLVEDQGWFFDTELLAVAEHNGLRIHEVPVDWIDDADSRVDVVATATDDLRGVVRVWSRRARGVLTARPRSSVGAAIPVVGLADRLVRFASIGATSTLVAGLLFVLFVPAVGPLAANALAFALCAGANAAAHRRFTFALRGRQGRARHWTSSLMATAAQLVVSTLVLAALLATGVGSTLVLVVAVTAVNVIMAVVRFNVLSRLASQAA